MSHLLSLRPTLVAAVVQIAGPAIVVRHLAMIVVAVAGRPMVQTAPAALADRATLATLASVMEVGMLPANATVKLAAMKANEVTEMNLTVEPVIGIVAEKEIAALQIVIAAEVG